MPIQGEKIANQSLNKNQQKLLELLRKIRKLDGPGWFCEPVDPVRHQCHDYFQVIPESERMDMGTMEEMIRDGKIRSVEQFCMNMDMIVSSCRKYNADKSHPVRVLAESIAEEYPKIVEMYRAFRKEQPHLVRKQEVQDDRQHNFTKSYKTVRRKQQQPGLNEKEQDNLQHEFVQHKLILQSRAPKISKQESDANDETEGDSVEKSSDSELGEMDLAGLSPESDAKNRRPCGESSVLDESNENKNFPLESVKVPFVNKSRRTFKLVSNNSFKPILSENRDGRWCIKMMIEKNRPEKVGLKSYPNRMEPKLIGYYPTREKAIEAFLRTKSRIESFIENKATQKSNGTMRGLHDERWAKRIRTNDTLPLALTDDHDIANPQKYLPSPYISFKVDDGTVFVKVRTKDGNKIWYSYGELLSRDGIGLTDWATKVGINDSIHNDKSKNDGSSYPPQNVFMKVGKNLGKDPVTGAEVVQHWIRF